MECSHSQRERSRIAALARLPGTQDRGEACFMITKLVRTGLSTGGNWHDRPCCTRWRGRLDRHAGLERAAAIGDPQCPDGQPPHVPLWRGAPAVARAGCDCRTTAVARRWPLRDGLGSRPENGQRDHLGKARIWGQRLNTSSVMIVKFACAGSKVPSEFLDLNHTTGHVIPALVAGIQRSTGAERCHSRAHTSEGRLLSAGSRGQAPG